MVPYSMIGGDFPLPGIGDTSRRRWQFILASNKLRQDRQWSGGLQLVLTLFGFGATAEELNPASAFKIYCQYGYRDEATRLGNALSGKTDAGRIHVPELTLSLWHVLEGRYKEADLILRSMEHAQADQWGILFDIDEYCLGARSILVCTGTTG